MLSIGIHIHKDSVCFAKLELQRGKPKLLSLEEVFFEGQKLKEEKFAFISDQIERIASTHKAESLRFCWGLSQSSVTSFLVKFPFKEKFKILKTLPFEIEDQSPFRSDKVCFDARICEIESDSKSSVLCCITPEDNVTEFNQLSASIKPPAYLLSCEGSGLANLLESWNKPLSQKQNPLSQSFFVYLGKEDSQLLVYRKGHLDHISVLDWGTNFIVDEMAKFYKLDKKKAWDEFLKKSFILTEHKGFNKEQIFFSQLIKKQIRLLIPKLNLLKISLEAEQKTQIDKLVLFGPGSVVKNLTAFLSAELSFNVTRLKSLAVFPQWNWESKSSTLIALGLALEGLKSSPYQGLNFLQSQSKGVFSVISKKWQKAGLGLLLFFVIFTTYSFFRQKESSKVLDSFQEVFTDYGQRIAFLSKDQINVDSVNTFLKREKLKVKSKKLIQKKLNQTQAMDYLKIITQKIGSAESWDLSLRYLKIDEGKVDMEGLVKKESLEQFKNQIQGLAKGSVKENPITFSQRKEVQKENLNKDSENQGEDLKKDSVHPKNKDLKAKDSLENSAQSRATQKEELEKKSNSLVQEGELETLKDQVAFSYSFEIKEEI